MKLNEFSIIKSLIHKTKKRIRLNKGNNAKYNNSNNKEDNKEHKINTNDKNNEDIILLNDEE